MKLILMDKVTWEGTTEKVAKELIAELFGTKTSYLIIDLIHQPDSVRINGYKLFMNCTKETEAEVLKALKTKFNDKVKISVKLARSSAPSSHQKDITTNEMTIDCSLNYTCKSETFDISPHLIQEGDGSLTYMQLTIIAHIEEENEKPTKGFKSVPMMILEECLFPDLTIKTGSGTEIKAHKSFLAASSPVLRRNFESGFRESQTATLDMTDISDNGVRAFLRYLYCQELEDHKDDVQLAYELFCAGHKYDVAALETSMMDFLMKCKEEDFTVEVAFAMYTYLRTINTAVELKTKVLEILTSNMDELETLPEYNEVFEKTPAAAKELCKEFVNATANKKRKLSP